MAKARGCLSGPLSPVQELALRALITQDEIDKKQVEDTYLKFALIANNPEHWVPIFYQSDEPVDVQDFLDEDGMPDFNGATVKYLSSPTPEEAEDILRSMLGDLSGTLRAEDTIDAE